VLIQRGKKQDLIDAARFTELCTAHEAVEIDLGTGDGRYVLREARAQPERLCIGLDAVAANLVKTSSQALRKPTRGGAANALFVIAAIERLPELLTGCADRITVNFPWGSLLEAVILPRAEVLGAIAALGKPGAEIEILINLGIFEDPEYAARLELPDLDQTYLDEALVPAYAAAGIAVELAQFLRGPAPVRTTWGQRLTLGSGRATLHLRATVAPEGEICDHDAGS